LKRAIVKTFMRSLVTASEAVSVFHEVWAREAPHLPITTAIRDEVARLLQTVPIARP